MKTIIFSSVFGSGLALVLLGGCWGPQPTASLSPSTLPPSTSNVPGTQTTQAESIPLAGTNWELLSLGNGDNVTRVSRNVKITIRFTEHSYSGGDPRCGSYGGTYSSFRDELSLGPTTWAWEAPADDAVAYQEYLSFVQVINRATSFRLTSNRLFLYADNGTYLVFD